MRNISDEIEQFIISNIGTGSTLNLSRNMLADFFDCVPSQINYVLSTRFTLNRGFAVESRRGGGGFIKIIRLSEDSEEEYLSQLLKHLGKQKELDFTSAVHVLQNLQTNQYITEKTLSILKTVISPSSLQNPIKMENKLRLNMVRNIVANLLKEEE